MNAPASVRLAVTITALLALASGVAPAAAAPVSPRAERLAARAAERAFARESIAAARAARAEARLAAIAPTAVVPPPRPATVRRMVRAGVPLNAPVGAPLPPAVVMAPPTPALVVVESAPARPAPIAAAAPAATPAPQPQVVTRSVSPTTTASDDVAADGTRSVLATAEEAAPTAAAREPAGPAVTHPPIELLPTPAPQ